MLDAAAHMLCKMSDLNMMYLNMYLNMMEPVFMYMFKYIMFKSDTLHNMCMAASSTSVERRTAPAPRPHRVRTASAPRPHRVRTAPARRPHRARTAPAPRPHCARTAPAARTADGGGVATARGLNTCSTTPRTCCARCRT